ncbi:SDR family oxidoreductase [Lysobacter sp. S4-A87]|uniref:SDR family NAD(P)-dependent oxidoreductase n=1 Tax=Lysobacter sp. S4-A87 TaxID=2925843 RepID=UPI001F53A3F7|nr:SDR family oxidoreductase [Lysobacter sp. S4-A87]UNK48312.1 SDR family oxidoreductase [Lysobacter sp. S4-A87]
MKSPVARPAQQASAQKASVARTPVVVLGATGGVGRGVVEAALAAGRPVIAVARDKSGLQCLKSHHPKADLSVVAGSISSDADGERLAKALGKLGRPIGGVIAAVSGSSGRGRLLDHPAAYLRQRLDEDLLPHLAAARHLLPLLAQGNRGGTYVLIGGPGAEQPWAGYGHRSIATAALRMLARVLHEEARSMGVRVQLLSIDSPVSTELNREHACPQWPSAIAVGQRALALVEPIGTATAAQAVVRYADVVPNDSVDVDSVDAGSITSQVTDEYEAQAQADAQTATEVTSGPDALLPSRCLQDARTLLRNLLSPSNETNNNNPPFSNQEPSSP